MNRDLIEAFAAGGPRLRAACAELTPQDCTAALRPGKWSIHELVVHLADSDAIAIDRMKRVLTQDEPALLNADETAYVAQLFCHEQSLEDALTLFEVGRRQWARVLRKLPAEAFGRVGVHNQAGRLTLADLLQGYTDHLDHHLQFLLQKRESLGKPITQPV